MAATISGAALSPWTVEGASRISTRGNRRPIMLQMSWNTAPVGEVTTPIMRGKWRQAALAGCFEKALLLQLHLQFFQLQVQRSGAFRHHKIGNELHIAPGFVEGDSAVGGDQDSRTPAARSPCLP